MHTDKKTDTARLTEMSLMTAVSLIIFIVESRIPGLLPVPGMKPGLANTVTVAAVYRYRPREAAMIVLARILLGSLFTGNVSVLIYSISGAALSLAGMLLIRNFVPEKYLFLTSIAGAMLHNTGQTIAACAVMRTTAVFVYLPVLLTAAAITGLFTGLCAKYALEKMKKHSEL